VENAVHRAGKLRASIAGQGHQAPLQPANIPETGDVMLDKGGFAVSSLILALSQASAASACASSACSS
jgi:hypothetical protein